VALAAAVGEFEALGWDTIVENERQIAGHLRRVLAGLPGVRVLGPGPGVDTLPVISFTVDGVPPALVAARRSAEHAIGVRYLIRLLGLSAEVVEQYRKDVLAGDRRSIPGAVRVSAYLTTTVADVDRLARALASVAAGDPSPVEYEQDVGTGDFHPVGALAEVDGTSAGGGCSVGSSAESGPTSRVSSRGPA
jgi:selenocysteine lyase/cysteine desulfurase